MLIAFASVAVFACIVAATATARPHMSAEPVLDRVHLHRGRLWKMPAEHPHTSLPRARAAIVGGSRISIEQAPWQVLVLALIPESETILTCGGSILDDTEILTAAHCVFNPSSKARIAPEDILVGAGSEGIKIEPEQVRLAGRLRVHPYYSPSAALPQPDDVAVIGLETPLTFNADVQPIAPITAGTLLPEGAAVNLTGFGQEQPEEELSGELNGIGMTLGFSRECGGEADALFLCASSPDGSPCSGDSGSGLTLPGAPATLAGVDDVGQVIDGKRCQRGAIAGYANLAAPEIRDFVFEGNENPPRAPRGGGAVIRGVPMSGHALTCEPGRWSGTPTFTYLFVNSSEGAVLQQGASLTYTLRAADVGRSILCEVLATNAGGTGVGRTPPLGTVMSSPQEVEEAAKRKHAEEEAAAKKRQQETGSANGAPAKGGVLGTKDVSSPRPLTRAQLLAKALKACAKRPTKHRRARCAARAHKKYASRGHQHGAKERRKK